MTEPFKIPTREEHRRLIRKIWMGCILLALGVFAGSGGSVLTLFLSGKPSAHIVNVSTSIFQVILLSYGLGFFVPAFLTSLVKMSLGVEMSRQTIETMQETKEAIVPVVNDVKEVVGAFRAIVEDVKKHDLHRVVEFVDQLSKNGTVEALATNIKKLAERVQVAVEAPSGESKSKEDIVGEIEGDARGMEDL
jgi:hypothetical protein